MSEMPEIVVPSPTRLPVIGQTPLERMVRSLQAEVRRLKQGTDTGWITMSLVNGWTSYDTSYHGPARYRRVNGIVYTQGLIKTGGASNLGFFTLPVGFRPNRKVLVAAICASQVSRLDVDTNGVMSYPLGSGSGAGDWNSIVTCFPVDQ